jgi:hypothetical protein
MLRLMLGLALLLVSLNIQASNTSKQELVSSIINLSSIKISVNSIPSQLSQIPAMLPVDEQDKSKVMEVFMTELSMGFNEYEALKTIENYLVEQGNVEHFEKVVAWLKSANGKLVTQTELLGLSVNPVDVNNYIMSFNPASYDQTRLKTLEQIVKDAELEDMMFSMIEKLVPPMVESLQGTAFMQDLPMEQQAQFEEEFNNQLTQMRQSMGPMIVQQMVAAYAYTYRDLSQADLQTYAEFISSDAGKHYYKVATEASIAFCVDWLSDVMPKIITLVETEVQTTGQ